MYKICWEMSNLLACKRKATEYWIVLAITYSKEALGCCSMDLF